MNHIKNQLLSHFNKTQFNRMSNIWQDFIKSTFYHDLKLKSKVMTFKVLKKGLKCIKAHLNNVNLSLCESEIKIEHN